MLDLSSEDGWQWSKFRIGKHARQDPNGVRGHDMARLPGGDARESGTADPGEALEEAASSASPPRWPAVAGGREREREREREEQPQVRVSMRWPPAAGGGGEGAVRGCERGEKREGEKNNER